MSQEPARILTSRLQEFRAHGFKLSGIAETKRLHNMSQIEGPTAILAKVTPGARLHVGAFCNLSGGTLNNVHFGRYCSTAQGVVIGSHEHPTDWLTTSRTAYYPEVNGWDHLMAGEAAPAIHARKRSFAASCPMTVIGPDVWIGQGAFIKSGVEIGAGAVIGARATVVKNVPPYAIVVGTPGRILRLRFAEAIVERLMALQWWQYSIYDLFDAPMDDIETAVGMVEDMVAAGEVAPYRGPVITVEDLVDPASALAALGSRPIALAS